MAVTVHSQAVLLIGITLLMPLLPKLMKLEVEIVSIQTKERVLAFTLNFL